MALHPTTNALKIETQASRNKSAIRFAVLWIFAACGIFAIALILTSSGHSRSEVSIAGTTLTLPDLCQFKRIFARDCPGCGMTRSFIYTARLQLDKAWSVQPIGTLLAIFLAASIPYRIWQIHQLRRGLRIRSTTQFEASLIVTLALSAYVRWFWNLI